MFVYCFTNTVNGKRYVGITDRTLEDRWYKHLTSVRNGSEYHFHRAIRKHGEQAFEGLIVEECSSLEGLKEAERRWIWLLASNLPERGYNMTLGGDGVFGLKMSEETRRQMSASLTGRTLSAEHKQRISDAAKRRYQDPAERVKTQNALAKDEVRCKMIGRAVSEETRQKMSVAARKRRLNKE